MMNIRAVLDITNYIIILNTETQGHAMGVVIKTSIASS